MAAAARTSPSTVNHRAASCDARSRRSRPTVEPAAGTRALRDARARAPARLPRPAPSSGVVDVPEAVDIGSRVSRHGSPAPSRRAGSASRVDDAASRGRLAVDVEESLAETHRRSSWSRSIQTHLRLDAAAAVAGERRAARRGRAADPAAPRRQLDRRVVEERPSTTSARFAARPTHCRSSDDQPASTSRRRRCPAGTARSRRAAAGRSRRCRRAGSAAAAP